MACEFQPTASSMQKAAQCCAPNRAQRMIDVSVSHGTKILFN
jgi:hypothetical protein